MGLVGRRDLLSVFLRSDEGIAREVGEEISALPSGSAEVTADVEDGVVTLRGSVRSRSTADSLRRQIGRIEGVVSVLGDSLVWEVDDVLPPYVQWRGL
ncbi:BON domain-containing protein [Nocardiopsis potens]|uniref:BON domain-containing protein n=1 Tax=Nocardiopsis potens TaxID=1246458 RepID=UPI0003483816